MNESLLVGHATGDDAAVLRIDGTRALVQTVDFFTPVVDDPELFGAIAATNSVSDIYAMGAEPILGLAIAGFPTDKLPLSVLEGILRGGANKAAEAGFPVAGGHTIIDDVPKYGLAVTGVADADRIIRNSTAKPDDLIYLTKPIGNGITISANRAHRFTLTGRFRRQPVPLAESVEWMLRLNRDAARAMVAAGASAATDVTGYGLAGHLLEMCDGASLSAELQWDAIPLLGAVEDLVARGYGPSGTRTNVATFARRVSGLDAQRLSIACDAQTSGGLLIAIAPDKAETLEREFDLRSVFYRKIGAFRVGHPSIAFI